MLGLEGRVFEDGGVVEDDEDLPEERGEDEVVSGYVDAGEETIEKKKRVEGVERGGWRSAKKERGTRARRDETRANETPLKDGENSRSEVIIHPIREHLVPSSRSQPPTHLSSLYKNSSRRPHPRPSHRCPSSPFLFTSFDQSCRSLQIFSKGLLLTTGSEDGRRMEVKSEVEGKLGC